MIKEIAIEKGGIRGHLTGFLKYNFLIGPNGSGKTLVLAHVGRQARDSLDHGIAHIGTRIVRQDIGNSVNGHIERVFPWLTKGMYISSHGVWRAAEVFYEIVYLRNAISEGYVEHGVVLWEYPELALSPDALRATLHEVLRLTVNEPIQLFATTQSLEALNTMAYALSAEKEDRLAVYKLYIEDGWIHSSRYRCQDLVRLMQRGIDIRQ